jgi:hypothetical protein
MLKIPDTARRKIPETTAVQYRVSIYLLHFVNDSINSQHPLSDFFNTSPSLHQYLDTRFCQDFQITALTDSRRVAPSIGKSIVKVTVAPAVEFINCLQRGPPGISICVKRAFVEVSNVWNWAMVAAIGICHICMGTARWASVNLDINIVHKTDIGV